MNDLEELMIYKQYMELIYYTLNIVKKYPKSEKLSLVNDINVTTYNGMRLIIEAQKNYNKVERLKSLNKLDIELKMLKVLVRISYRYRYISKRNYAVWSKKLTNICSLLGGWIKTCLKQ